MIEHDQKVGRGTEWIILMWAEHIKNGIEKEFALGAMFKRAHAKNEIRNQPFFGANKTEPKDKIKVSIPQSSKER